MELDFGDTVEITPFGIKDEEVEWSQPSPFPEYRDIFIDGTAFTEETASELLTGGCKLKVKYGIFTPKSGVFNVSVPYKNNKRKICKVTFSQEIDWTEMGTLAQQVILRERIRILRMCLIELSMESLVIKIK